MEIRLLLDHREDLVAERTRTVNRLRWHLLALCPELERSLKRGALNQARELDRVDRQLRKLPDGARVRVAREQVSQLRSLNRRQELHSELLELVTAHRPQLLAELGCGALTAAILIGHTPASSNSANPQASVCRPTTPIPCSSGKRTQHRLNRGGDRQLNTRCTSSRSPAPSATPPPRNTSPPQRSRRQDHQGRAAQPQAPPCTPLLPAPRRSACRPAASLERQAEHRAGASDRGRAAGDPAAARAATSDRPDHPGPAPFPMVCIS